MRSYTLPPTVNEVAENHGDGIRALASWTLGDLTATRLQVAHRIAAGQIPAFDDDTPAHAVRQAADLAYAVVIDTEVHKALDRQAEFERLFIDLDDRVAEVRAGISSAVDQAVTRALAGALAIAIAALASPRVRGVPALIAAVVVALYLFGTIGALYGWVRAEARSRLDDARDEIAGRRSALSDDLAQTLSARIAPWREQINGRVNLAACILGVLAVVIVIAGAAGLDAADDEAKNTVTCECTVTTP